MRSTLCICLCFILGSSVSCDSKQAIPQDDPVSTEERNVVNAATAYEAFNVYRAMLDSATESRIQELKSHPHRGIALTAAWESVRRTIPLGRQSRAVKPDISSLQYFIGFVEGTLKLTLPEWWKIRLLNTQAYKREHIWFVPIGESPYYFSQLKLWTPRNTTLRKVGNDIVAVVGNRSCKIDAYYIKEAGGFSDALNVLIGTKRCYVALHSNYCSSFTIFCLDRKSNQILWSAEVWAAGEQIQFQGPGDGHWVEMSLKDDTLYLFGSGGYCTYLEAFDSADGENLFRFNTSY